MYIEDLIKKAVTAANSNPIDWNEVSSVRMLLSEEAKNRQQRLAVDDLKRAVSSHQVHMACIRLERAFLAGKPTVDGWPRK